MFNCFNMLFSKFYHTPLTPFVSYCSAKHGHILWQDLALADAELTSKYIDSDGKVSHIIFCDLSHKNQSAFSRVKKEIEKEYVVFSFSSFFELNFF